MHCEALDPEMLGYDSDDPAQLQLYDRLNALLFAASVTLIDELIDDVAWAGEMENGSFDAAGLPWVFSVIPARFQHRITYRFVRNLLVAGTDLASQLSRGWFGPGCVMQSLLVDHLLNEVEALADMREIDLGPDWRDHLEDALLRDTDHRFLYSLEFDGAEDSPAGRELGISSLAFDDWFEPYAGATLPTFLLDR